MCKDMYNIVCTIVCTIVHVHCSIMYNIVLNNNKFVKPRTLKITQS